MEPELSEQSACGFSFAFGEFLSNLSRFVSSRFLLVSFSFSFGLHRRFRHARENRPAHVDVAVEHEITLAAPIPNQNGRASLSLFLVLFCLFIRLLTSSQCLHHFPSPALHLAPGSLQSIRVHTARALAQPFWVLV